MATEINFPCPFCGAIYHFTTDEARLTAPCPKCGKELAMPHGSFDMTHATSMDPSGQLPKMVMGLSNGGMTADEWAKLFRAQATEAIRSWEEIAAKPSVNPGECRAAELKVFWALWSFRGKSMIVDGKRYKGISRAKGLSVSVTPVPEKKRKKGSTGSADG